MSILQLDQVGYSYTGTRQRVQVLRDISYQFSPGSVYGIVGRSGAGKTTLLSLLSGLTLPTSGRVLFDGRDLAGCDRYRYRSRDVGVVFQSFNLLPSLTATENIVLSMHISGKQYRDYRGHALKLLQKVGIEREKADRRVLHLSGGEQQRVAIARALSYDPAVILADEPTGNLDETTQDQVMAILTQLAHRENKCVIIVTHSPAVARQVDMLYKLAPLQ